MARNNNSPLYMGANFFSFFFFSLVRRFFFFLFSHLLSFPFFHLSHLLSIISYLHLTIPTFVLLHSFSTLVQQTDIITIIMFNFKSLFSLCFCFYSFAILSVSAQTDGGNTPVTVTSTLVYVIPSPPPPSSGLLIVFRHL